MRCNNDQALVLARNNVFDYERAVVESGRGLVFFGTPHGGSQLPKDRRVQLLKFMAKSVTAEIPKRLEASLETGADELFDMADEFRTLSAYQNRTLYISTYFEARETAGLGCCVSL